MKTPDAILQFRHLFRLRTRERSPESQRSLFKWLLLGTLIGVGSGIGIILFYEAIRWLTSGGLGLLVGYRPPDPAGEGSPQVMPVWTAARPWLLPIVTALGALVASVIVYSLAPEAEGHGTDSSITAFHEGRSIHWRTPLVKLFTSALLMGTGGSAGPEGPAGQIGAGFGSAIGRLFCLESPDKRITLASGIGAGVGAIFRAPLGGALLAAEILYKDDLEVDALIPALISSIVAYSVFGAWVGWNPIFLLPANAGFSSPFQLFYYVILGLFCGGIGLLFSLGIHSMEKLAHRLTIPRWIKPALGGLLVGLIGLAFPQILGMSYGWVQIEMGAGIFSFPIWLLLLLPLVKILATSLSVGSGGPGGLFGPGIVIGGMLGAAVWRLCYHTFPGLPSTPAPFVIVGMMALLGSISRAPLAMMLMVAEMTGSLSFLAPAMSAVGVAYLVVGHHTMYLAQPATRADSPVHQPSMSFPLLGTLTVRQAMVSPVCSLRTDQNLIEAWQTLNEYQVNGTIALDAHGHFAGILTRKDIQRVQPEDWSHCTVSTAMTRGQDALAYPPDLTLDVALEEMTTRRIRWAPVLDADRLQERPHVIGLLTVPNMMKTYRAILARDARRTRGLSRRTTTLEPAHERKMSLVDKLR